MCIYSRYRSCSSVIVDIQHQIAGQDSQNLRVRPPTAQSMLDCVSAMIVSLDLGVGRLPEAARVCVLFIGYDLLGHGVRDV